jgi:hypothetical protein
VFGNTAIRPDDSPAVFSDSVPVLTSVSIGMYWSGVLINNCSSDSDGLPLAPWYSKGPFMVLTAGVLWVLGSMFSLVQLSGLFFLTLGGTAWGTWTSQGACSLCSLPPSLPEAPSPEASLSSYWPARRWPPSGRVGLFFPHLSFKKLAPGLPALSSEAMVRGHTFGLCCPSRTS